MNHYIITTATNEWLSTIEYVKMCYSRSCPSRGYELVLWGHMFAYRWHKPKFKHKPSWENGSCVSARSDEVVYSVSGSTSGWRCSVLSAPYCWGSTPDTVGPVNVMNTIKTRATMNNYYFTSQKEALAWLVASDCFLLYYCNKQIKSIHRFKTEHWFFVPNAA